MQRCSLLQDVALTVTGINRNDATSMFKAFATGCTRLVLLRVGGDLPDQFDVSQAVLTIAKGNCCLEVLTVYRAGQIAGTTLLAVAALCPQLTEVNLPVRSSAINVVLGQEDDVSWLAATMFQSCPRLKTIYGLPEGSGVRYRRDWIKAAAVEEEALSTE